jgi:DNA-binding beta-propeller fold protein YncE
VVDRGNNRVVVLGFNGETFSYIDSYTAGFNAPTSVAYGAPGILAVADSGNNRIVVLDLQGKFIAEYLQPTDGYVGLFNTPRGVAVDGAGNLVVADTGNGRIVNVIMPKKIWLPTVIQTNK